ncbi:MAG: ComF family protein [Dechloromonas sp.]|nr:ComF family protein [Dechloromonas sp.]
MSILTQPFGCSAARRLGQLGTLLVPGSCLLCAADCGRDLLCPACQNDLPLLPTAHCAQCAQPLVPGQTCADCRTRPPPFRRTLATFCYQFPVDRIIHALKYGHQLAVAAWAAQQLANTLGAEHFSRLIPLPLHPARLRERGFNQALEIARHLEKMGFGPVDRDHLHRQRPTAPQAGLPFKARAANVRGAFVADQRYDGEQLLLIDDVMTTAETASECARILSLHGAAEVSVAVVARALKDESVL